VTFLPLPDIELQRLSDDDLIAYVRGAHGAGELAAGRRALALLVFGYERDVRRRLSLRVPAHVIEDVAHDALVRAIAAAFDGTSVGEFRSWLHTIVDRAAVDFFRRAERRPKESILPSEHAGQEDVWGAEPSIDSEAGAVELRLIVEEVLETFNETHRLVIDLHVFGGLTVATALAKWGVEVLVVDGRRRARYASGGSALRPWATSGAAPSSKARSPGIRTLTFACAPSLAASHRCRNGRCSDVPTSTLIGASGSTARRSLTRRASSSLSARGGPLIMFSSLTAAQLSRKRRSRTSSPWSSCEALAGHRSSSRLRRSPSSRSSRSITAACRSTTSISCSFCARTPSSAPPSRRDARIAARAWRFATPAR
jgi:RNA polymerase sigma factor (sigma-70 family)